MAKNNTRRAAAFAVARWLATKDFPSTLLPDGPDRAFVQDLVYTVIRRLRPLRKVLGELLKTWPKGELEALVYVGAAQILYMDDVPDFAAVSETVEAAKACSNPTIAKVVNGVLRNLIRRRTEFEALLASEPVAVRESFPSVLVRRWTARFGDEAAARLCAWHNQPAETYLARRDGTFVVLERGQKVTDVAGYGEGAFIVQDPGTAHAVALMDVQSGERVLDACAAPGGKTVQLAWRGAQVVACEVNPKRRTRLVENLARLGLSDSVTVVGSFEDPAVAAGGFAKVLVDAPCSNTGVLRRRPDARWNWNPSKLAELVKLQGEILDRAAGLVDAGGRLVYSTCSNETEENTEQIDSFIARNNAFSIIEQYESIPTETGYDGAFACALKKN